jgi:hypothetical protein
MTSQMEEAAENSTLRAEKQLQALSRCNRRFKANLFDPYRILLHFLNRIAVGKSGSFIELHLQKSTEVFLQPLLACEVGMWADRGIGVNNLASNSVSITLWSLLLLNFLNLISTYTITIWTIYFSASHSLARHSQVLDQHNTTFQVGSSRYAVDRNIVHGVLSFMEYCLNIAEGKLVP